MHMIFCIIATAHRQKFHIWWQHWKFFESLCSKGIFFLSHTRGYFEIKYKVRLFRRYWLLCLALEEGRHTRGISRIVQFTYCYLALQKFMYLFASTALRRRPVYTYWNLKLQSIDGHIIGLQPSTWMGCGKHL